jgi:hypothetical protein
MRALILSALSVALAAGVAFAATTGDPKKPKPVDVQKEMDEKCGPAPYGLVDLNGKTASKEEMEEAKFQVTSFITQVDVYQDCMLRLAKTLGDRLTDKDARTMSIAIAQSQSEKEAVGAAFNNAVCEYNHVNKIPDNDCKDGKWKAVVVEQAPAKPAAGTAGTTAKPAKKPAAAATTTTTTTGAAPAKPKTTTP